MEFMDSAIDEFCVQIGEEKRPCKNLEAERRRRKKLSDHLLALRSVVPIITDMTRAAIVKDAVTYIHELKSSVDLLTQELLQIDATPPLPTVAGGEVAATSTGQCEADDVEEIKPLIIKEENVVDVSRISEKKLWIKIMMEKKKGRFSKLLEAMARFGFELTDTTATTCKGIMLFSSFVQGTNDTLTVEQTKEHLLQMVRGI